MFKKVLKNQPKIYDFKKKKYMTSLKNNKQKKDFFKTNKHKR